MAPLCWFASQASRMARTWLQKKPDAGNLILAPKWIATCQKTKHNLPPPEVYVSRTLESGAEPEIALRATRLNAQSHFTVKFSNKSLPGKNETILPRSHHTIISEAG